MQWLTLGVFLNCVAQVAFTAVQGVGKPARIAVFQLIELPFYLLGMWLLTKRYGLMGVVAAWDIRAVVDVIVLFALAARALPGSRPALVSASGAMTMLAALLAITAVPETTAIRVGVLGLALVAYVGIALTGLVKKEERVGVLAWVRERRRLAADGVQS
jgi:O-antigen/teichoic acid export membrane protein